MTYLSVRRFGRSLNHALHGFQQAASTEHSFRVHALVAVVVIVVMLFLHLTPLETALIIFVLANILILELVNTVVERFVGLLEPRIHPYVGVIKDLMAAAVLIISVASIFIGLLVFLPALGR
jgi:diacylglycerol kinase